MLCAQAWKPSSQHAGEKRGVANAGADPGGTSHRGPALPALSAPGLPGLGHCASLLQLPLPGAQPGWPLAYPTPGVSEHKLLGDKYETIYFKMLN